MPDCTSRMGVGKLISTPVFHPSLSIRSSVQTILSLGEGIQATGWCFIFTSTYAPFAVNITSKIIRGGRLVPLILHWHSCVVNTTPEFSAWPAGNTPKTPEAAALTLTPSHCHCPPSVPSRHGIHCLWEQPRGII